MVAAVSELGGGQAKNAAWPSKREILAAVAKPSNLCPELQGLTPAQRGPLGIAAVQGEYAVVVKVTRDGATHALRCFLKDVPQQAARTKAIQEHQAALGAKLPKALTPEVLYPQGISVGGRWFPVSLMPWVKGPTLDNHVERLVEQGDQKGLRALADKWRGVARELQAASYAHGDPAVGNIIVDEAGELKLIDHDGAVVPTLVGMSSVGGGNCDFQHPERAGQKASLELDRFPNLVLNLSLRALAADLSLWEQFHDDERLILGRADFEAPGSSKVLAKMQASPDAEVRELSKRFAGVCDGSFQAIPTLEELLGGETSAPHATDKFERGDDLSGFFQHVLGDATVQPRFDRPSWLANHSAFPPIQQPPTPPPFQMFVQARVQPQSRPPDPTQATVSGQQPVAGGWLQAMLAQKERKSPT